ncbi:MAG: tRNA (guanosine(46)-N7)-methyltransferase TrmB [Alphaproteobacteria bacterium]
MTKFKPAPKIPTSKTPEEAEAKLRSAFDKGEALASRNLYGKRVGRPLKDKQVDRMENLLPEVAFDLEQGLNPADKNWLEIGFGGGEHLAWQAKNTPEANLVGVEYFANGVAKALEYVDTQNLQNIRIHHGDARDVMDVLEPECLDRAFILHPDPWPKRRHWPRRIVQVDLIKRLAKLMKPGAELRIATDHYTYLIWILRIMSQVPEFTWQATKADDWRLQRADWPQTRYEAKGLKQGRPATYLSYLRMD